MILWTILRVAFPIKASALCIVWAPIKVCIFLRMLFQHIIQLCSKTILALFANMCLHSSLSQVSNWDEWALYFSERLLDVPLIYVLCDNCSTLCYLSHFSTCSFFVVATAPLCSKLSAQLCNSAKLPYFSCPTVIMLAPVCKKVSPLWDICASL